LVWGLVFGVWGLGFGIVAPGLEIMYTEVGFERNPKLQTPNSKPQTPNPTYSAFTTRY
jgi:hypothetical protein